MTLAPFPITDFPGLDLASAPDDSGCIDLLNCDLDRPGVLRSRDGLSKFNSIANPVDLIAGPFIWGAQNRVIGSGSDLKVYVYNSSGVLLYTSGTYSATVTSVAEYGSGTTSYLYLAFASTGQIVRLTTGGTFSSPAGMPVANFVAVQPSDNRLAAANVSGHPSRVQFSDPGDAETWGANNYVDLHPNDGQSITGMVTWSNFLFVFKDRKLFVFYGNSVDNGGNPIFNYRTVDNGIGSVAGQFTAAPDGVYFGAPSGVYRTTGGPPVKVSTAIDPLFRDDAIPFCPISNPVSLPTFRALAYCRGRIYLTCADQTAVQYVFVYDVATGQWLPWRPDAGVPPFGGLARLSIPGVYERVVFASSKSFYSFQAAATTDNGVAITSRYRSGFMALNYIRLRRHWVPITSQESTVRETVIDGTGTINFAMSRDFGAIPTTGGGAKKSIVLGTSPAVAQNRHREAQRGRRVSWQIDSTGPWSVQSLVLHLRGGRPPGIETT